MDIDTLPEDPTSVFARWYADAQASEPDVPDAMQLVTVGPDGRPSIRTVLMKGFGDEGFVFYTNFGSRKARELARDERVSACFHWKSLQRQVLLEGVAERIPDHESDLYHQHRPRGSQIGAWASRQSERLGSRDDLERRVAACEERFRDQPVPRPPFWGGFRIAAHRIEFWQGRSDRLHDRIVFERGELGWNRARLYP